MNAFEYAAPVSKEDAVRLLSDSARAVALAGGTDLLSLIKDGVETPTRLVDLKSVAELRGIRHSPGGVELGATTALEQILQDERLSATYPALAQAIAGITSPQIRARGTLAGELCQRPRCWYYRGGFGLLAQRDGQALVPSGDNRYHAIFGNDGPAYFVHPSSLAPALIVLGARANVFGPRGARQLAVEELFRVPAKNGEREVTLGPAEFVTSVLLPAAAGRKSATYEVRQRTALDWPLAAAAAALQLEGGVVRSARIVLGHVAPIPWRAARAEEAVLGGAADVATATRAADAATAGARTLSRNAYKVRLVRTAVKRALLRAFGAEV